MTKVHISIANQLSELATLAEQINLFGKQHALSEPVINELVLICEELLSNTINYGYSDQQPHRIGIALQLSQQQLQLTITDDAKAFNPFTQSQPELGQPALSAPIGGLGLPLVTALSEQQHYRYQQGKNCIEIIKTVG